MSGYRITSIHWVLLSSPTRSLPTPKNIRDVNPNLSSYCVLLSVLGPVEHSPMNTWTGYGRTDDWLEGGKTLRQIEDEKTGLYMNLSADHFTPGKWEWEGDHGGKSNQLVINLSLYVFLGWPGWQHQSGLRNSPSVQWRIVRLVLFFVISAGLFLRYDRDNSKLMFSLIALLLSSCACLCAYRYIHRYLLSSSYRTLAWVASYICAGWCLV